MSRLRLYPEDKAIKESHYQQNVESGPVVQLHHMLIEAVPVPVGTNEYDPIKVKQQGDALRRFRTQARDMFEPNDCRCVTNAGQRLYQTNETYGTNMTVEQMVETMKNADLTMRVNFRRPGVHSATTCMELSHGLMDRLLSESPDAKGQKTLELRVKAEAHVAVPRHGAMFISIIKQGAVHTLAHIDYKIMSSYDQMYHSN